MACVICTSARIEILELQIINILLARLWTKRVEKTAISRRLIHRNFSKSVGGGNGMFRSPCSTVSIAKNTIIFRISFRSFRDIVRHSEINIDKKLSILTVRKNLFILR